jgi:hypothetical protein
MAKETKEAAPKLMSPDFRHEYKDKKYGFECKLKPLTAKDFDVFMNLMAIQEKIGQISPKDRSKAIEKFQDFTKQDTERLIKIVAASITEWNLDEEINEKNLKELLPPMVFLPLFVEVINLNFREQN